MSVPSLWFFAFTAVAALLLSASRESRWRSAVFLCANVLFVLTFTQSALQLAPLAIFLVAGFIAAKWMAAPAPRTAFFVCTAAFVLGFAWLKRYAFEPAGMFLSFPYLTVGLSYVFFRVLSLIIDSYQQALPASLGPVEYVNYTLNFTSLISGPIQSFGEYLRTARDAPAALGGERIVRAIERIILGSFKVSVLSPLLAAVHATSLAAAPGATGVLQIMWPALAVTVFPIYLYINFSGYMDTVIGAATFLRLELPENFDRPFTATGFIEFWSRWHMTLSKWLKTYVFSPLLLNLMRRFPAREIEPYLGVAAFFVTFFLVGVWHGQTSEFLFYGVLQGLGVSGNKLFSIVMLTRVGRKPYRALCSNAAFATASRALTFAYFSFTLIWFWSSWDHIGSAWSRPALVLASGLVSGVLALIVTAIAHICEVQSSAQPIVATRNSPYLRAAWSTALATITLSVTVVLNAPAPHIVYRAF